MSRSEHKGLQPFDVIEMPAPKPPKVVLIRRFSIKGTCVYIFLSLLVDLASLAWIICIVFYGTMPWLPGPVNAWHHRTAFNCFMAFGLLHYFLVRPVLLIVIQFVIEFTFDVWPYTADIMKWNRRLQQVAVCGFLIFGFAMVCYDDPIVRTCTRSDFPVHFKLGSVKDSVRGSVKVKSSDGHEIWDMVHYPLRSNPDVFTFKVLRYNSESDNDHKVLWPTLSAVSEVTYDFTAREDHLAAMVGYCGFQKQLCLNGTVQMAPLMFEWTYIDPQTSETEHKVLSGDGRWRFGKNRPYVQLYSSSKDLVFSAPASKVICGGGDGDLRTAVVPAGIIMIAEQQYNGRY